jgi:hypothetical protein
MWDLCRLHQYIEADSCQGVGMYGLLAMDEIVVAIADGLKVMK